MFRAVLYLLIVIFLISIVRAFVGIIMKGLSDMTGSSRQQSTPNRSGEPARVPLSGELKKDPVCGTYTSMATSVKQVVGGQTFYFCSAQCRDKYVASH